MIKALWPPSPCIHTFRNGSPCPNDGKYGTAPDGPRSCWRHLTDAERLTFLETSGEQCMRTYGDGRPCSQQRRYREPSPGASPSCWRHLSQEEKQAAREREAAREKELAEREPDPTWGLINQDSRLSSGNVYLAWDLPPRLEGQSDLDYLRTFQAGRCAWCGYTEGCLVKDHDHDTELVRGLLCVLCNGDEAKFGRYVTAPGLNRPHAWDLYRRIPPATLLSIRIRYANSKRCRCGCQTRRSRQPEEPPERVTPDMVALSPGPFEPLRELEC